MNENEIKKINRNYTLFPYTDQCLADADVFDRADGIYLFDKQGKSYMDLSSQFINVNIGYGNVQVIEAVHKQMQKLHYVKPTELTEIRGKLCRKIIDEIAPENMSKIYLTLGGSDANDFAIRIAKAATGRRKILSQYYSYHGATIGAANLGGGYDRIYERLENKDYIHFMGFNNKDLERFFKDEDQYCDFLLQLLEDTVKLEDPGSIAAICFETISLGNIVMPPKRYYKGVRDICNKYDILLMFDEVLVGFGRTGRWFACEHYQVEPDIITFAKGVTSTYMPLGGVMVSDKVAARMDHTYFSATLTASYHPVSCAAAYASIQYIQENHFIKNSEIVGNYLSKLLREKILPHPYVNEVRGIGLLHSIIFYGKMNAEGPVKAFAKMLQKRGFIVYVDYTAIILSPPIIINKKQIQEAVEEIENLLIALEKSGYYQKLEFYPNQNVNAAYYYTLEFMDNFQHILQRYEKIMVMGSANASILKIVVGNLQRLGKAYKIFANKLIYECLDDELKRHCIEHNDGKFDINLQKNTVKNIQSKESFDCVLMPYVRTDCNWENVLEVAKEFCCPIYRITHQGEFVREYER